MKRSDIKPFQLTPELVRLREKSMSAERMAEVLADLAVLDRGWVALSAQKILDIEKDPEGGGNTFAEVRTYMDFFDRKLYVKRKRGKGHVKEVEILLAKLKALQKSRITTINVNYVDDGIKKWMTLDLCGFNDLVVDGFGAAIEGKVEAIQARVRSGEGVDGVGLEEEGG